MLNNQQAQKLANFFKENVFPALEAHEEKLDEMYEIAKKINNSFKKTLVMDDFNKTILKGTIMKQSTIAFKSQNTSRYAYSEITNYPKTQKDIVLRNKVNSNVQLENRKAYIDITKKILDPAS